MTLEFELNSKLSEIPVYECNRKLTQACVLVCMCSCTLKDWCMSFSRFVIMGSSNLEVVVNLAAPGTDKQRKKARERHLRCMLVAQGVLIYI